MRCFHQFQWLISCENIIPSTRQAETKPKTREEKMRIKMISIANGSNDWLVISCRGTLASLYYYVADESSQNWNIHWYLTTTNKCGFVPQKFQSTECVGLDVLFLP